MFYQLETAVDKNVFVLLTQVQNTLPKVKNTTWVNELVLGVAFFDVIVDTHPRGGGAKTTMFLCLPLEMNEVRND